VSARSSLYTYYIAVLQHHCDVVNCICFFQCFDTVGFVTGRASSLSENLLSQRVRIRQFGYFLDGNCVQSIVADDDSNSVFCSKAVI